MIFSFKPRTLLSNLHPSAKAPTSNSPFKPGDKVYINYGKRIPIVEGVIVSQIGETRYLVFVEGVMKTPHVNQLSFAPL